MLAEGLGGAELRRALAGLVQRYFAEVGVGPEGGYRVPLAVPSFGAAEVVEAFDSLLSGRATMGEKVRRFEQAFAAYVGVRHGVMVNSGSSANLLALAALVWPGGWASCDRATK